MRPSFAAPKLVQFLRVFSDRAFFQRVGMCLDPACAFFGKYLVLSSSLNFLLLFEISNTRNSCKYLYATVRVFPKLEAKMIEEIFEQLKDLGAVSSTDDFSTKWLGRERSYMRCLRAKQRDPSAQVLATCAVRLLRTADSVGTTIPWSRRDSLRSMANTCLEALLSTGVRQ